MSMLAINKTPLFKYNKYTNEVMCKETDVTIIGISPTNTHAILKASDGYYIMNITNNITANVYIPAFKVSDNDVKMQVTDSVVYFGLVKKNKVINKATIGLQTMLVYSIEPEETNYNVMETDYFYQLYGTKLMYTLTESNISGNTIDSILEQSRKITFKDGILIDVNLLKERVTDDYDEFEDYDTGDLDDDIEQEQEAEDDFEDDFEDDIEIEEELDDEEDDFDDEDFDNLEDEDLEELLVEQSITYKDYCEKSVLYYLERNGGRPTNTLITKDAWLLFSDLANKARQTLPIFADLWQAITADSLKSDYDYDVDKWDCDIDVSCLLTTAFMLVANVNGVYNFSEASIKTFIEHYARVRNSKLGRSGYIVSREECIALLNREQDVNTFMYIPYLFSYGLILDVIGNYNANTGVIALVLPMDSSNSYEDVVTLKERVAYAKMQVIAPPKFSYSDYRSWLTVDHLRNNVKSSKFKYSFKYNNNTVLSEYVFNMVLNSGVGDNFNEHTFMSDVYNLIAAPNTFNKTPLRNRVNAYEKPEYLGGRGWAAKIHFNMALRFMREANNNVCCLWDDIDTDVMPAGIRLQGSTSAKIDIPQGARKYYASSWTKMCPDYDLYLRHNFKDHAFRETIMLLQKYKLYYLADLLPHDDNYVCVTGSEAKELRQYVYVFCESMKSITENFGELSYEYNRAIYDLVKNTIVRNNNDYVLAFKLLTGYIHLIQRAAPKKAKLKIETIRLFSEAKTDLDILKCFMTLTLVNLAAPYMTDVDIFDKYTCKECMDIFSGLLSDNEYSNILDEVTAYTSGDDPITFWLYVYGYMACGSFTYFLKHYNLNIDPRSREFPIYEVTVPNIRGGILLYIKPTHLWKPYFYAPGAVRQVLLQACLDFDTYEQRRGYIDLYLNVSKNKWLSEANKGAEVPYEAYSIHERDLVALGVNIWRDINAVKTKLLGKHCEVLFTYDELNALHEKFDSIIDGILMHKDSMLIDVRNEIRCWLPHVEATFVFKIPVAELDDCPNSIVYTSLTDLITGYRGECIYRNFDLVDATDDYVFVPLSAILDVLFANAIQARDRGMQAKANYFNLLDTFVTLINKHWADCVLPKTTYTNLCDVIPSFKF